MILYTSTAAIISVQYSATTLQLHPRNQVQSTAAHEPVATARILQQNGRNCGVSTLCVDQSYYSWRAESLQNRETNFGFHASWVFGQQQSAISVAKLKCRSNKSNLHVKRDWEHIISEWLRRSFRCDLNRLGDTTSHPVCSLHIQSCPYADQPLEREAWNQTLWQRQHVIVFLRWRRSWIWWG